MPIGQGIQHEGAVKPDSISVDSYEQDLFAARITEIPTNHQMRIEYDGAGNAYIVGYAPRGLSENTTGWLIHAYSYDSSSRVISRKIAYDSWTNRATATYG
jgi:YD repeat-containing protein